MSYVIYYNTNYASDKSKGDRVMAILKCKMCGGDLEIIEGSSICVCEYCGTEQTVPKVDDERKVTLFVGQTSYVV